jgi:hypothetical protein
MNETKKPLEFEEWDAKKADHWNGDYAKDRLELWEAARQGMIPADRAMEIPEVGEWPDEAKGISIRFCDFDEEYWNDLVAAQRILYIPRPTPAWTPKSGEAVYAGSSCNVVIPTRIENGIVYTDGWGSYNTSSCKPFSESAIGKPWGEI